MTDTVRILQLSDTHFLEEGVDAEGGGAYNTSEAFDAVFDHVGDHGHLDMVVVTGDVADHGRPAEYRKAADAFSRFRVPVNVCPGNHDFDAVFSAGMARIGVSTSRVIEVGAWAFLFVDSSAGTMLDQDNGLRIDPPGQTRLHTNGSLGRIGISKAHSTPWAMSGTGKRGGKGAPLSGLGSVGGISAWLPIHRLPLAG